MNQENSVKGERLQVALARVGLASRRGVVTLIESGKVTVNDKVVLEKGFRVDTSSDKITVDGKEIPAEISVEKRYFIFNKPKGVMTTLQDPHATRTIADFFKEVSARLFPVGRLDRDTTGLIIMTNDGDLAFRLTHPKFGVKKRYHARVVGIVSDITVKHLEKGIELEEGKTAPCEIKIENVMPATKFEPALTDLFVTLHEGKKRQIRRIFDKVGHRVLELERLSYGPISLGHMRFGEKRELKPFEVKQLEQATGMRKSSTAEEKG
ncbi:MAG: hypothetical protein AUJ72_05380 [Candidatus Omnitrophica bacterium CG1_02_46_14]|nr:MAG: hypothetical protein AUJ72_05380 [Candidatus Omnitrophica bacterium CG1_02_46_14]